MKSGDTLKIAILGSSGHYQLAFDPAIALGSFQWAYAPVDADDLAPKAFKLSNLPATVLQSLQCFENETNLLNAFQPDIAIVNPPFHRIAPATFDCLRRGISVFAEKPIALHWKDFATLQEWTSTQATQWIPMMTMRYEGIYSAAQSMVAQGFIGQVTAIKAQKSYPLLGWNGHPRPGFYHNRETFGGIIPWIGIHLIDLFTWFAQSPISQILAEQTRSGFPDHGDLESIATLQIEFASGVKAQGKMDFLKSFPKPGEGWGEDILSIEGEKGSIEIRNGRGTWKGPQGVAGIQPDPVTAIFPAFLDWVIQGIPMRFSQQDCLLAIETALRARDAADQNQKSGLL